MKNFFKLFNEFAIFITGSTFLFILVICIVPYAIYKIIKEDLEKKKIKELLNRSNNKND